MRIQFERTGGFAGLTLRAALDSEQLEPNEGQALIRLVENAGFFDLPGKIAGPPGGADRFQYRLTVEWSQRRHTVEVAEAAVPAALQPLIQRLTALARRKSTS